MARPDFIPFLLTGKNAYFYQKKKSLTKSLVDRILQSAMRNATGNALQRVVRRTVQIGGKSIKYSFALFREKSEPRFLDGTKLKNVEHCFILLCELPATIAVMRSHAHFADRDLKDAVAEYGHGDMCRLYMRPTSMYERIGLRMMNLTRDGIHASTLEAPDLARSMSTLGTNRAIPTALRVKSGGETHTVTPNTSRVSKRDGRSPLRSLLNWMLAVEAEVARTKPAVGFIDHFASPVKLAALPAGVLPTGIMFTLGGLIDGLEDGTYLRVVRQDGTGHYPEIAGPALERILGTVRQVFDIEYDGARHWLCRTPNRRKGELKLNKNSMAVSGRLLKALYAERPNGERVALSSVINEAQDFLVCFSDPRYAYFSGLFFDGNLLNQIDGFMSTFVPVPQLAKCTSEKGILTAQSTKFPTDCVLGVIHQHIAVKDDFLLCDDLGDEWADAIGVCTAAMNPSISFYVAKHKAVGLSASNFQDVIGQAQKNLGHLSPIAAEISAKTAGWGQTYRLNMVTTHIPRLLKGTTVANAVTALETVLARPITQRRMCLVISFLSKAQLEVALGQLKANGNGPPQLIQLLWFVTGFIGACRAVNAVPLIYCQP